MCSLQHLLLLVIPQHDEARGIDACQSIWPGRGLLAVTMELVAYIASHRKAGTYQHLLPRKILSCILPAVACMTVMTLCPLQLRCSKS